MNKNKTIYNAIFDSPGFSTDLSLSDYELNTFRALIEDQYLDVIKNSNSLSTSEVESSRLEHYHTVSHLVDHKQLWHKKNRCLPQKSVSNIKDLDFMKRLREIFGNFKISSIVYDNVLVKDSEEIYWRIVRPEIESDVGPLHADNWFHEILSPDYIPQNITSVKIWIPIYCEPGKNGLMIVPDSHKREWKYNFAINSLGQKKPVIEDAPVATLLNTPPGNMVIFSEKTLHGGSLNKGLKTRVSAEITLLLETKH